MEVQLQQLSEMLSPPSSYIDRCKNMSNRLFRIIQLHSKFDVDRCRVAGGLEKKTSTALKVDCDLVVFVNIAPGNILDTKKAVLDDWNDILLMNTAELTEHDIHQTPFSLQFFFGSVPIDLLVAINFSSTNQRKLALDYIKNSSNPTKVSSNMSSELTETSIEFMQSKSKFVHDVARLAKYWSQTVFYTEYVSGRSTIMEMVGVMAALEEENNSPKPSYQSALKKFLNKIKNISTISLVSTEFYSSDQIPKSIANSIPLILDPTNPYNNLLDIKKSDFIKLLMSCAGNTLEILQTGTQDLRIIFFPQPMLYKCPMISSKIGIVSEVVGWRKSQDSMAQVQIRYHEVDKFKHIVDNMLNVYNVVIKNAEAANPSITLADIQEVIKKTSDKMQGRDGNWITCSDEHDQRDVTLKIPLQGCNAGWAMWVLFNIEAY